MEVLHHQVGRSTGAEVQVQIKRTIYVGQTLKINPSEGYLGINSGNIRVQAILPYERLTEYSQEVYDYATEHATVELGCFGDTPEYNEEYSKMFNGLWVVYEYTYDPSDTDPYAIPLEMFVQHTMMY